MGVGVGCEHAATVVGNPVGRLGEWGVARCTRWVG